MTMSTTDVQVKKINTRRRSAREREPGGTSAAITCDICERRAIEDGYFTGSAG